MAAETLQTKMLNYLQDTCAMEHAVLNMLDSAIATTDDPDMKNLLRAHREETLHHGGRLQRRLDELGCKRSPTAEISAAVGSWLKGFGDTLRGDKPGKNLRDAFVTEHLEIASYELLERLAVRAGDEKTAEICRLNKKDEYEMAKRLSQKWDAAVMLTLEQSGMSQDCPTATTSARRPDVKWEGSHDQERDATRAPDQSPSTQRPTDNPVKNPAAFNPDL